MRPTPEELIATHELSDWAPAILKLARPCLRAVATDRPSRSHAGGLPLVDEGFEWPQKDGWPLQFVACIEACAAPLFQRNDGSLLFFYDDRHWGVSPKDRGHAVVVWQHGTRPLAQDQMPRVEQQRNWLLWKSTKIRKPKITRQVGLEFFPSKSFPSLDRGLLKLPGEAEEELYTEFLDSLQSPVQIGGYPAPIQSDDMEADCAKCLGVPKDQWVLMLQSQEIGDQRWGDAGCLYWFIPGEDLSAGRLDRVWMVTQCS
jgi:uncharacterized protein YwqG